MIIDVMPAATRIAHITNVTGCNIMMLLDPAAHGRGPRSGSNDPPESELACRPGARGTGADSATCPDVPSGVRGALRLPPDHPR